MKEEFFVLALPVRHTRTQTSEVAMTLKGYRHLAPSLLGSPGRLDAQWAEAAARVPSLPSFPSTLRGKMIHSCVLKHGTHSLDHPGS